MAPEGGKSKFFLQKRNFSNQIDTIWLEKRFGFCNICPKSLVVIWFVGTPDRIRTCDPLIRSQVLYPTELPAHILFVFPSATAERKTFDDHIGNVSYHIIILWFCQQFFAGKPRIWKKSGFGRSLERTKLGTAVPKGFLPDRQGFALSIVLAQCFQQARYCFFGDVHLHGLVSAHGF